MGGSISQEGGREGVGGGRTFIGPEGVHDFFSEFGFLRVWELQEKIADLGSRGYGSHFFVNILERIIQKLRIIVLLRSVPVAFRFHFGTT